MIDTKMPERMTEDAVGLLIDNASAEGDPFDLLRVDIPIIPSGDHPDMVQP